MIGRLRRNEFSSGSAARAAVAPDGVLAMVTDAPRRYWPEGGVDSALFRARFPDRERLVAMARLAAGRQLQFWQPWHMEMTHEPIRWRRPADWLVSPTGDVEWTYALLRGGHLLDLAAAHTLGEPGTRAAFLRDLRILARLRRRPHAAWDNALSAALRLQHLIAAHDLLRDGDGLPDWAHGAVAQLVVADRDFLHAQLGRKAGNQEFAIVTAVLLAIDYFGDALDGADLRPRAAARLAEILDTEVLPGGAGIEQVPMYHGVVVLQLLNHLAFLARNGLPVDDRLERTVAAMVARLVEQADPEGRIPPIGDSDRHPVAYVVAYARAVLGASAVPVAAIVRPDGDDTVVNVCPDTARAVVRRWRDDGTEHWLLFDGSGKPPAPRDWHSHPDDLQFLLHTADGPLATDPGRFTYASAFRARWPLLGRPIYERGRARILYRLLFRRRGDLNDRNWRLHFARSAAHNVLTPGGRDLPGYGGRAEAGPRVALEVATVADGVVCLAGELASPAAGDGWPAYRHRRTILSPDADRWLVVDRVRAEAPADWVGHLHLGAGVGASGEEPVFHLAQGERRHTVALAATAPGRCRAELVDDWVSEVYNRKVPATALRWRLAGEQDFALVTSIVCREAGPPAAIAAAGPALVVNQATERGVWWWRLADTDAPGAWAWGPAAARVAWVLAQDDAVVARGEVR